MITGCLESELWPETYYNNNNNDIVCSAGICHVVMLVELLQYFYIQRNIKTHVKTVKITIVTYYNNITIITIHCVINKSCNITVKVMHNRCKITNCLKISFIKCTQSVSFIAKDISRNVHKCYSK